ncbi:MAG: trypsin-like peptidase domain-containing protein [Pirellulales bacterium]
MVRSPYGRCPTAAALALVITSLGLSTQGAEPIQLLDFWSPHCGPCMGMKPTVHSFIQAKYPIREVDTTQDQQTSRQYGVSAIPCFVMLVDGQEVDRRVGAMSSADMQQMFEKAKDIYSQSHRTRTQSPDAGLRAAPPSTAIGPNTKPDLSSTPNSSDWPPTVAAQPLPSPAAPTNIDSPTTSKHNADFPVSLLAATVRICVDDPQGRSFGTGTIIDSRSGEALIATCGHLFRESQGKGPMTVEMFEPNADGTVRVVGQVPGQLISCDLNRDVAFVSIKPGRPVTAAPVAAAHTAVQKGDRVATIGCSNGKDPTMLSQRVNQLDRYAGAPNFEVSGAPEQGRSGGGVFNLQGQLIGVCYAADYEGKEGLYAALESIHSGLDELKLSDVYAKSSPTTPGNEILIRGQVEPDPSDITPIRDPASQSLAPLGSPKSTSPQNLSNQEQAAFGEIMNRASTSEVVVIVRPKTPGGQSEVITLDNVSPDFVKALAAQRRAAAAPTATR